MVTWTEHEVVGLPYLFGGGSEGDEGVGKDGASEFPDNAVEVAWVGADGGHLGRMGVDFVFPSGHDARDLSFPAIGLVYLL